MLMMVRTVVNVSPTLTLMRTSSDALITKGTQQPRAAAHRGL